MLHLGWLALSTNFFGPGWLTFLTLVALGVWLASARALLETAVLTLSLMPFFSVYHNIWHEGLFFVVLVFGIVLGFRRGGGEPRAIRIAGTAVIALVLLQHVVWTAKTLRYDLAAPYSGSHAAAEFLRARGIDRRTVFGAGFGIVAIEPYFERNLFANYTAPGGASFWDWSLRSSMLGRPSEVQRPRDVESWVATMAARRPEYFLVALKMGADDMRAALIRAAGYRRIAVFPGALFWKDHRSERETYELYARPAAENASPPTRVPNGAS
jgi:hypothetical protein